MIQSYGSEDAELVFRGVFIKKFSSIGRAALRKLLMLDAAHILQDLRVPPGNRLEALKGKWAGYHSIRINDQWRICFIWKDAGAYNVSIEDYH